MFIWNCWKSDLIMKISDVNHYMLLPERVSGGLYWEFIASARYELNFHNRSRVPIVVKISQLTDFDLYNDLMWGIVFRHRVNIKLALWFHALLIMMILSLNKRCSIILGSEMVYVKVLNCQIWSIANWKSAPDDQTNNIMCIHLQSKSIKKLPTVII